MKKKQKTIDLRTPFIISSLLFFLFGVILTISAYPSVFHSAKLSTSTAVLATQERMVPIVAVSSDETQGFLGSVTVRLLPGQGHVLVETSPFLETDLQSSANTAVAVAKQVTGKAADNYDFAITYHIDANVVGGGSAGAATTLAAIAALENKQIKDGIALTGAINPDGTIGPVGGVLQKAQAAAKAGDKTFLVPTGQTTVVNYQRVARQGFGRIFTYDVRAVPQTFDLKNYAEQQWGMDVEEIGSIQDVMTRMLI